MTATAPIRDRITELRRVKASELLANPKNWRKHPAAQSAALSAVLHEVGYADALLARETPHGLELIDGHLRQKLTPDQDVPVLILDVTEDEANKILLTLDPLAALAESDKQALDTLLRDVSTGDAALQEMLSELAAASGVVPPDWGAGLGLPQGEKSPFEQMTFTLSERQAVTVRNALAVSGSPSTPDNENSNGNALFAICEAYLGS